MTILVELPPDVEAQLTLDAEASGLPREKYAGKLIEEYLATRTPRAGKLTPAELRQMLPQIAEGSDNLPILPTSAFTRESSYEERF